MRCKPARCIRCPCLISAGHLPGSTFSSPSHASYNAQEVTQAEIYACEGTDEIARWHTREQTLSKAMGVPPSCSEHGVETAFSAAGKRCRGCMHSFRCKVCLEKVRTYPDMLNKTVPMRQHARGVGRCCAKPHLQKKTSGNLRRSMEAQ